MTDRWGICFEKMLKTSQKKLAWKHLFHEVWIQAWLENEESCKIWGVKAEFYERDVNKVTGLKIADQVKEDSSDYDDKEFDEPELPDDMEQLENNTAHSTFIIKVFILLFCRQAI